MQKFDHVLLASDFDNTLVYTQSALDNGTDIPPMCPRNREALDYFIQNGGLFAISTGRALPAFMDYAKDVPMSAPCVIANGAAIYDFRTNEYLYTAFLGKAQPEGAAGPREMKPLLAVEDVVRRALSRGEAELLPVDPALAEQLPQLPTTLPGTLCVCPDGVHEGFFVARLRRKK